MANTRIILEEANSPINGPLTVVRDLAWGTYIKGGGLPQSGGLAKEIWEKSLREVKKQMPEVKSMLVLGFGGGGISNIAKKLWPTSKVFGVDIDPVMVDLGKKYLKWERKGVNVEVGDASEYLRKMTLQGKKFDLVCVDMYVGSSVPDKFNTHDFVKIVKQVVGEKGLAVFNRLYGPEDRVIAHSFAKVLESEFAKVDAVYPEANVMYLCK